MERMENDRIAKRFYVGKWVASRSVERVWKRWIDPVKEFKGKEVWMSGNQGE